MSAIVFTSPAKLVEKSSCKTKDRKRRWKNQKAGSYSLTNMIKKSSHLIATNGLISFTGKQITEPLN